VLLGGPNWLGPAYTGAWSGGIELNLAAQISSPPIGANNGTFKFVISWPAASTPSVVGIAPVKTERGVYLVP
jgi:hypothetical protein